MLSHFLHSKIKEELPFAPNEQQEKLLEQLSEFVTSSNNKKCFILHGYAGTGKTSIISGLVKTLNKLNQKPILMAPTGRATKVFSLYADFPAFTIHKTIYRQKSMTEFRFMLNKNLYKNRIFIIDEASMISGNTTDSNFGSGNLLEDVIQFVYSGENCSLIFLGDSAQLPPVEEKKSPALTQNYMESFYNLNVNYFSLTEVVRQARESGILMQATKLRTHLTDKINLTNPTLNINGFKDVIRINGSDLIERIDHHYNTDGKEETIIITRSNKRANLYNNGIRKTILMKEDEISNGDLLMITKNNYFWNKEYEGIDFIANGEVVQIEKIRKYYDLYGFQFADMTLRSLDYDWEIDAKILIDGLQAENPAKMNEINKILFNTVAEDYQDKIKNRRKLVKKVLENEFFNALQTKFAYAITCHKAQGGQWKNVFIDYSYIPQEQLNEDYYRWLYTAITRATERVYLVNFPENWFE